jgi:hypothetical protein
MGRMGQMGNSEGFIGGLVFHLYRGDIYFIVRKFANIVLLRHISCHSAPTAPNLYLIYTLYTTQSIMSD